MSPLPRLRPQELVAVANAHVAHDDRPVLAVRAEPSWDGPDEVPTRAGTLRVRTATAPLEVCAALVDAERSGVRTAVLTPLDDHALGLDVQARLVKGRVVPVDPWTVLESLCEADVIDPQLVARRWLADLLIDVAPPGGWPPAPGRVLTVDHAWACLDGWLFDATWDGTIGTLLGLVHGPHVPDRLARLGDDALASLAERAAGHARLAAAWLALAAEGAAERIVPVGLVLEACTAATTDPELARLQETSRVLAGERLLGGRQVEPATARDWVRQIAGRATDADRHTAETLLGSLGAGPLAVLSDELPNGFEQRLARAGRVLAAALDGEATGDEVHAAVTEAGRHRLADRNRRVDRLRAAALLTARPAAPAGGSLADLARWYVEHGRFIDRDRELVRQGDTVPELVGAYRRLLDTLDAERSSFDQRFATELADWSRTTPLPDDPLTGVEHVLDRVVAPLAAKVPVLVLVIDGLSHPVAVDLFDDLARRGWAQRAPDDVARWCHTVVAALPTVTDVSRASLLCGQLKVGDQAAEVNGFTTHPRLASRRPVLIHKRTLAGGPGQAIDPQARAVVADPARRVVGVVVNAVDDHLARGDQIPVDWHVDALGPLPWLLDAAAEAGRALVVVADHGHVIDHGAARRAPADAGERWHPGEPADGEVLITGPRVLKGGGRVAMPWREQLTYGTPKHGYHGGATPAEVLCPCAVLVRDRPEVRDWPAAGLPEPDWHRWEPVPGPLPIPAPVTPPRRRRPPVAPVTPTLFEAQPWVDRLLATELLKNQRARAARAPVKDEQLRAVLTAVHGAGGAITYAALATATGISSPARLTSLVQAIRRLLNVEGYQVLEDRDGTVRLNTDLLDTQFGVRP